MQWPFKTTVRYVQEHKTVRIQYAVCADNVAAAKRELLRRFTEQQVNMKLNTWWLLRATKPRGSIFPTTA